MRGEATGGDIAMPAVAEKGPRAACEEHFGSYSIESNVFWGAHVAQPAERVLGKDEVTGSNPVVGSTSEQEERAGDEV